MMTTIMMPTRTIWFSIGFALAQMLSLYKRFRRAALAMGGALIVAMAWLVFSPAPQFASYRSDRSGGFISVQSERIYGIKHRDVGVLNRAIEFEQAKRVFLKSPVIGVGYGYWYTIWQYLVSGTGMPGFWTTNNVHNDIMNVLVKGGVFGALLFAAMLFQLTRKLYELRKRHKGTVRALWPTVAVIAVYSSLFVGTTTPVYQTREAIFFLVIILALGMCAFEMEVDKKDAKA
jgi:O-antigen ligase